MAILLLSQPDNQLPGLASEGIVAAHLKAHLFQR